MKFLFPFCFSHFAIQFVFRAYSALLLCLRLCLCSVMLYIHSIVLRRSLLGGKMIQSMMQGDQNVSIRFKIHTITRSILSHNFLFCVLLLLCFTCVVQTFHIFFLFCTLNVFNVEKISPFWYILCFLMLLMCFYILIFSFVTSIS